ncbi:MAG: hypothetical protein EAZ81_11455 [Verrucomicrobia bacterium]|nr:MAG: hypothetical protein EAZ81_11455 [Verrucomicrobiota bacterium]
MMRGLLILTVGIAVGLGAFFGVQMLIGRDMTERSRSMPTENGSLLPELSWLQSWLILDANQMQKVKALHLAYLPKCKKLCHRVHLSNEQILQLSASNSKIDPVMRKAIEERATLHIECQEALLTHVYQISSCLRPEQSRKYLDLMVPYALGIPVHNEPSTKHHP